MKTKTLTFSLVGFILTFSSQTSFAAARPECSEWKKSADALVDQNQTKLQLKPGKKMSAVLEMLKKYPEETSFEMGMVANQSKKEAVETAIARPVCGSITYFEILKRVLESKSTSLAEKKLATHELLARIIHEEDQAPSFINFLLRIRLIEIAIHAKALSVSDEAYFNLSRLDSQANEDLRGLKTNNQNNWACVEKKNCNESEIENIYSHIRFEFDLAKNRQRELLRWAMRVSSKN